MKSNSIKKHLIALGSEFLADRLIELSQFDDSLAKELEMLTFKNDPDKLAKKINQQINGIKRSKKFIPWNQTHEITDKLDQIIRFIEHDLLPLSSTLAIDSIEKLFNVEECIYERADDSSGSIGITFSYLVELWGKAWAKHTDRDVNLLCDKLLTILMHHQYYSTNQIIHNFAQALGSKGLITLEKLVSDEKSFNSYALKRIYTDIADVSADLDKYIDACEKYGSLDEDSVCDIAERLIKKSRIEEAIDWLLHKPKDVSLDSNTLAFDPDKVNYSKRFDLLIEAYDSETMLEEAQSLRWILFKKTLSTKYFKGLVKHQDKASIQKIKTEAYQFAFEHYDGSLHALLSFLYDLQDYEKLDLAIITYYNALDDCSYSLYRPLSKNLVLAGFPLSACLLRRKLIEGVLNRAISKYYKYAISDLNLAAKYAESVIDWLEFDPHNKFVEQLKASHGRKSAFWSKISSISDNNK